MTGQSGPDPRHSMASHAPHRLFPIHTPHRPLKVTDIDRMTDPRTHMGRPIPYPTKSLAPANPRMIIRRSAHALMLVALCLSGLALAAGAGGAKQEVAVTPLVCVVCVSAQGAEPSREAIEQALAYNADRERYGLSDLGGASLQHMLVAVQEEKEEPRRQRQSGGGEEQAEEGEGEGEGGELPMNRRRQRRQLLHVPTAESAMLQNALMWKVNEEFAQAQQTLDEIRESNQLKPRTGDGKPHLGDGTYAKKIAQYLQRGKKLRGNSSSTNSTSAESPAAAAATKETTTPLPPSNDASSSSSSSNSSSDKDNNPPPSPQLPSNGAAAPSSSISSGGSSGFSKPPSLPPAQNRYGATGGLAHGGSSSTPPPSHPQLPQQQQQPQPKASKPQQPQQQQQPVGGLGTNAVEIEIPAVVPGFIPEVTFGIPDVDAIGSGGMLNAMPKPKFASSASASSDVGGGSSSMKGEKQSGQGQQQVA